MRTWIAQLACGKHSTMSGNNAPTRVNQHRIGESEFLDGCGNLGHLRVAVRPAVACVRDERIDLDGFECVWKFHFSGLGQKPPLRVVVQVTLPSQFFTHRVTVFAWAKVAAKVIARMMMAFISVSFDKIRSMAPPLCGQEHRFRLFPGNSRFPVL